MLLLENSCSSVVTTKFIKMFLHPKLTKFTQKQDKLYVAYLSAHVAALVYALAYSVSDGFTRDVPIYPFY